MYKYLLFDIDGTLLNFDQDMMTAFHHMYTESGLEKAKPLNKEILAIYDRCNERWWRRFEQGLCAKQELFVNRFLDFFSEAELPFVEPNYLNQVYFDALGETGTLFPGAIDMLKELGKHYGIYIVTNGNAPSQKTRMEHSGLVNYIQGCFISEIAGAAKPDKRYFDYVLNGIPGAKPEDCIVIGDSLTSDMCGAQNAGMDSVWYNPRGLENIHQIPVTYEVRSFDEILRIFLPQE